VFDADDVLIDGEIIAADETGRPVFVDLLRRKQAPSYMAVPTCDLGGRGVSSSS
jgi:ATP-dependent DNA ligase